MKQEPDYDVHSHFIPHTHTKHIACDFIDGPLFFFLRIIGNAQHVTRMRTIARVHSIYLVLSTED